MDNPAQNSLAKHILFTCFFKYYPMRTLYIILRTLVPPPTSMLLISMKSFRRNMFICANNIHNGERGSNMTFLPYILSMIVDLLGCRGQLGLLLSIFQIWLTNSQDDL